MADFTARETALDLDKQDRLAHFREEFCFEEEDLIYLDGNSLGRLPKRTLESFQNIVKNQWGRNLIRGWNDGWIDSPSRIGAKVAQLIGAESDEVVIGDSTSTNLFKLAVAGILYNKGRKKVITDNLNFPSDIYVLEGICEMLGGGLYLEVVKSSDEINGPVEDLRRAIDENTALVVLSHTIYKSSYTYDMQAVTQIANESGAVMLWDMSHSVGSVPGNLHNSGAALAIGCTYKYLNGGPGALAFLYVHRDWQQKLSNPIRGWFGHDKMFSFDLEYRRSPGIKHFLTGTPPILSTLPIEKGVDLLLEAGMQNLRQKSIELTEYAIQLWKEWLEPLGFTLKSPVDPNARGSHITLGHPEGWRIDQALIGEMNVIPDFRKPDNLRLGFAPIYTSFYDVWEGFRRIKEVVEDRIYEKYSCETGNTVT